MLGEALDKVEEGRLRRALERHAPQVHRLEERERVMVSLFVGLEGIPPHSLTEVAAYFGVLPEEVKGRLSQALARLQEGAFPS